MANIVTALSRLSKTVDKNIVVVNSQNVCLFPEVLPAFMSFKALTESVSGIYQGYRINKIDTTNSTFYVGIEHSDSDDQRLIDLIMLNISDILDRELTSGASPVEYIRTILDNARIHGVNEAAKPILYIKGWTALLENNREEYESSDLIEIINNTINAGLVFEYRDRIVIIGKDEDKISACKAIRENILTELYIECLIAVGSDISNELELIEQYDCCEEILNQVKRYSLGSKVFNFEDVYTYRIASSIDPVIKNEIVQKVFKNKISEMLNGEMETTIDVFFKNNLNLTDTAAKLYIHRNTLLYRIDKIYKSTGFDLRRFEDSWLFKLAWIISKEN